ncbi:LLM class flavin-dependent oxidoreductase [Bacillus aquiflavi]|uniref:LLM class flavin-dependent oxidoreductase n=1 Tax=Bacillus aquiflavi TaxID=2672567 RepID=A0A6B3VXC7_9BACI|nr:LLM class flavin-dependent oxidoreductase [Bacillus aquiflavi]MBA4536580.1 LLM class flavin-dependent oxidoreductase [Bacillus aquiflavi]NEY80947.1 LLM class flavin-dependent oxidoreductase [Bacillus aquiflavi]UAC50011.1 LLM class flavin-dependent oxidoreductase [Bacillus aquiflavi]
MVKKRIYLNAFEMNCSGHQSPGLWTHPEDKSSTYKDAEYWIHLAKVLEKGCFDAIFLADVLGTYDVYDGSRDAAVRQGIQIPVNDPAFVVPIMAQVTKHLGFGLTASTSFEHPYVFARRISTLDHLTNGRIGWNVVTSYLNSGAVNVGLEQQISHDKRYDIADEYMEVVYKLWEGSWEDDAVVVNKERRLYADPRKVHDIRHEGNYYRVPGAHLCEPSPQRTPVIFQAGASKRGREFAAKHAELVFISSPTVTIAKNYVQSLREEANLVGCNPNEIKVLSLLTPIIGKTDEEAHNKYQDYKLHTSYEGALALYGGWSGVDFSTYQPNEELKYVENDAIRSSLEALTQIDPRKKWTVEEVADFVGIGGMGQVAVGTPEKVADLMEEWIRETGVDGFNIAYAISPGTFEEFVEYVVPILQKRGLVRTEYEQGTFRNNLFGYDYLPDHHIGRQYRKNLSLQTNS